MRSTLKTKTRREARDFEKRAFILVLSIFIVMIGVSTFSIKANANTKQGHEYKYYTNYCVTSGDTLWDIAEDKVDLNHYKNVREYVKEVQEINHMKGDYIQNGTYIILPYYSSEEL